ncbi:hypothetical protein JHK84_050785 [Glycine max]|nr:hypothetical protein JHK84_050785 [Glycine max]
MKVNLRVHRVYLEFIKSTQSLLTIEFTHESTRRGADVTIFKAETSTALVALVVVVSHHLMRYKVFLGHKQYFVSLNVGVGKMQWYGFHQEPAGGADILNEKEAILRQDIYDRTPTFTWGKGHVTLLGDFIDAMQQNMGQGGCMAIEQFHTYPNLIKLSKFSGLPNNNVAYYFTYVHWYILIWLRTSRGEFVKAFTCELRKLKMGFTGELVTSVFSKKSFSWVS